MKKKFHKKKRQFGDKKIGSKKIGAKKFRDGIYSRTNSKANRRNAVATNEIVSTQLTMIQMNEIYKTGLGSKIVRLKAGSALNDTIQFRSPEDKVTYEDLAAKKVKSAAKFMQSFGRSIIIVANPGDDLSKPLKKVDLSVVQLKTFSGDMVSVPEIDTDLMSDNFYAPTAYQVRGEYIHHTRVVDFTYVEPVFDDKPNYRYGGISEFDLIYTQLIGDAVAERAMSVILEKNSTFFYKIKNLKDLIATGNQQAVLELLETLEDARGIHGAGIIDADDAVETVDQTLTNLDSVSDNTLRRIAMVCGFSKTDLTGESPTGLNASGKAESNVTQTTVENFQSDYLLDPINELMSILGLPPIKFKENQGETSSTRADYEAKVIASAKLIFEMGGDWKAYLIEKDIIKEDILDTFFGSNTDNEPEPEDTDEIEVIQ